MLIDNVINTGSSITRVNKVCVAQRGTNFKSKNLLLEQTLPPTMRHQNRNTANIGPGDLIYKSINKKKENEKISHGIFFFIALENPQENITDHTNQIWRDR